MSIKPVERSFKGVWIPADIWLCKELSVMEKLFLVEISSLDNKNGCYASNAHFSEFFNVGKARCSQIIKSLEAKKLLTVTLLKKGKLVQKRVLKCTGKSLKSIPKVVKKNSEKSPKIRPLKVVKILNQVVNKLNHPIKYIKSGYLINDQGSNTKIFNNTKDNKILSKPEISPDLLVVVPAKKTRSKKPGFIREIFNQYPAHRRGGTDSQFWKAWTQEKLTENDALKIRDWLSQAAQSDPQWGTFANGQFVFGLTRFIRERLWLTPIPVAKTSSGNSLDMDDMTWADNLNEGVL